MGNPNHATILVVDGDRDWWQHRATLLADDLVLLVVPDHGDVSGTVRRTQPNVVVIELDEPGTAWFELLSRLRADPKTSRVPVMVVAAFGTPDLAAAVLEHGAEDCLTRPYTDREVFARIRVLLEMDELRRGRADAELSRPDDAAVRERSIADQLQRSLLPERTFEAEAVDVATFYAAGDEGTQVGGDWYDIIDLGAGRTAFVIGDVMGRGVRAASVMGQLRSAVRAFAKLDLPPAEVLENLDGLVQDLRGDHIVTCIYATFDATDHKLRLANAGHLPPLVASADLREVNAVWAAGPPLGAGSFGLETVDVQMELGTTVVFYTDGLVESRSRDIDEGIGLLSQRLLAHAGDPVEMLPAVLTGALLPTGSVDDVAILISRVNAPAYDEVARHRLLHGDTAVADARELVTRHLTAWSVPSRVVGDVVLLASELVTNAARHGRPPIDLRLRRGGTTVVLEVYDQAPRRPRRLHAGDEDEGGRGLQVVSTLADRWGSRATGSGKSVWCVRSWT